MKITTARFGEITVEPEQIITFSQGILGFEGFHQYILIEQENSLFSFLQCVDQPDLSFVVVMPELLRADYQVDLDPQSVEEMSFESAEDGRVLAIVTVPDNVAEMTANLQAPIVINIKQRVAMQIVLTDSKYHTRHNVLAEYQKATFELHKATQSQEQEQEPQAQDGAKNLA